MSTRSSTTPASSHAAPVSKSVQNKNFPPAQYQHIPTYNPHTRKIQKLPPGYGVVQGIHPRPQPIRSQNPKGGKNRRKPAKHPYPPSVKNHANLQTPKTRNKNFLSVLNVFRGIRRRRERPPVKKRVFPFRM